VPILEAINLNRRWGKPVLDRQPRTETEFEVLRALLCLADELFEGRPPSNPEFARFILDSPQVREAALRFAPAAGNTQ